MDFESFKVYKKSVEDKVKRFEKRIEKSKVKVEDSVLYGWQKIGGYNHDWSPIDDYLWDSDNDKFYANIDGVNVNEIEEVLVDDDIVNEFRHDHKKDILRCIVLTPQMKEYIMKITMLNDRREVKSLERRQKKRRKEPTSEEDDDTELHEISHYYEQLEILLYTAIKAKFGTPAGALAPNKK